MDWARLLNTVIEDFLKLHSPGLIGWIQIEVKTLTRACPNLELEFRQFGSQETAVA